LWHAGELGDGDKEPQTDHWKDWHALKSDELPEDAMVN
jgi:hypothetical protein